jgi:hypothetical protein
VVPAEYRTIAKTKRQNIFHKQCRPLNFVVNCPRGISPMGEYKVVPELCKALVAVQAEFRGVAKDGRNPAFNSRYMTLDSILDDLRPLLVKNGLFITQSIDHIKFTDEGRLSCLTVSTVIHHVSGAEWSTSVPIPVVKPDAQGVGGCITYGRRYALCSLLMISADDDLDGNDAVAPRQHAAPQPRLKPINGRN